jgi:hypothetical protein
MFAEGMFNAEALAAADSKRRRPPNANAIMTPLPAAVKHIPSENKEKNILIIRF